MNIEKYSESVFESIAIDSLMKKCNISEHKAMEKLYEMYTGIDIFSDEWLSRKRIFFN